MSNLTPSQVSRNPLVDKASLCDRLTAAGNAALAQYEKHTEDRKPGEPLSADASSFATVMATIGALLEAVLRGNFDASPEQPFNTKDSN